MKIHWASRWLRRRHTWAPIALRTIDFVLWQLPWIALLSLAFWHASQQ